MKALAPNSPVFPGYEIACLQANRKGHAFPANATQISTGRSLSRPGDANGLRSQCLNCGDAMTVTMSAGDETAVTVAPAFECTKSPK